MKILYVLNSSNIYGGSTKSFLRYLKELLNNYTDIQAVICTPSYFPEDITSHIKATIYKAPIVFNIYPPYKSFKDKLLFIPKLSYKIIKNYISYRTIYKIAKKEKVEIIHTNVSVVSAGYMAAKKLGIPHIYHLREYQTLDFGMKIIPSFDSFADNLKNRNNFNICITYDIQKHFKLDDSNSKVIYNGVKHIFYLPTDRVKENYFLFVGRLEESKGIRNVVDTFISFSNSNKEFHLLIAGETNNLTFKKELLTHVSLNKMEKRIHFLGNREDIDLLMQKAKAIIVASSKEAFGLISAEAAFNKCLIIGKNTGGTAEQISNGVKVCGEMAGLGYLSDKELLNCMMNASHNNHQTIINSAYNTAKKLYTIESCAHQIHDFYSSILMK